METLVVLSVVSLAGLGAVLALRGADVRRQRTRGRRRAAGTGRVVPAQASPARVVLVDHDPTMVARLSSLLGDRGHQVITATSPAEARQLAAAFPGGVDVVVAGLDLGDHHGVAALGEVRRSSPKARGVILSGEVRHAEDVDHLLEEGVDLVRRPVPPEALVAAVERAASRSDGPGTLH